ncbi:hypothetical protein Theba_0526 [Mesotoga prima MesG1.Ag.4.2]|jgi:tetratricopeptide (TPR) repeat protein|uniref:Uncharacterized protein n=1 Tax=Mesotoga prima MesG1.Ag.4.2 TaxID=660470 RepID=I2F2U6_9BACT|nr:MULTISPECIES: tetratricopeptide repeat protein [Mesotoga]AFK06249.1 hypothetical protein Theba_0526 [Mesotoga prima MesG1.Ag.4.2]PIJ62054.1 hypothetical protein V513_05430 [Mesotoga sp. H07.pep.5.3]
MKSAFAVAIFLVSVSLIFALDNAELLLSKEYLIELQSLETQSVETKAILAIAVGLKYRETIQPNYKVWFSNLYEELKDKALPSEIEEGIKIVNELVSVSTVSALNMLYSTQNSDNLIKAISLRAFFYDWVDTRDPRSSEEIVKTAYELIELLPNQYFPYKALLEVYSSGSSIDKDRLMEIRERIFSEGLQDLLGDDLIESEFVSGLEELVLEDYSRLGTGEPVSMYYAAMAYMKMGESFDALEILNSIDLHRIPPRFASNASMVVGNYYLGNGDFEEAVKNYQDSLRFWPENSMAVRNLGMAYYLTKDRDYYDLARFYLQLSGYESFDDEVSSALKELRRRAIFELALVTIVPLAAIVVVGLFLLEYFSKKRKTSQERKAMKEDGGNNED